MEHPKKKALASSIYGASISAFISRVSLSLALGPCQFYLSMLVRILQPFENGP